MIHFVFRKMLKVYAGNDSSMKIYFAIALKETLNKSMNRHQKFNSNSYLTHFWKNKTFRKFAF